jgi:ATP-binding protein involved in chromosome partitioning
VLPGSDGGSGLRRPDLSGSARVCPHCGAKTDIFQSGGGHRIAEELNIPFLGSIPIDQKISEDSDKGVSFIIEHSDSASSKVFMEIVDKVEGFLKSKEKNAVRW